MSAAGAALQLTLQLTPPHAGSSTRTDATATAPKPLHHRKAYTPSAEIAFVDLLRRWLLFDEYPHLRTALRALTDLLHTTAPTATAAGVGQSTDHKSNPITSRRQRRRRMVVVSRQLLAPHTAVRRTIQPPLPRPIVYRDRTRRCTVIPAVFIARDRTFRRDRFCNAFFGRSSMGRRFRARIRLCIA